MTNGDVHFTGDKGAEIRKIISEFQLWAEREAAWIRRDRYLDRAWWRMIDGCDNVDAILNRYEKG